MERLRTHVQSLSTRRSLILIGIVLLLFGILTTTYVAQQRQEIRKRAQTACELSCNAQFDTCANNCAADPLSQAPHCQGNSNVLQCCSNFCNDQWNNCIAACAPTPTPTSVELAQMVSPTPGSILPSSTVTFNWSSGSGVSEYWLYVSTDPGYVNLLYSQSQGTNLSTTVSGIPTNQTIYVRLWSLIGGTWQSNDYEYGPGSIIPTPTPTTGTGPRVDSLSISPSSTTLTGTAGIQIAVSGVADQIRVYIHGTNQPTVSDSASSTYNPDSVAQDTFYLIGTVQGNSGTITLDPATPTKQGRYIIVANAQLGSATCFWNNSGCNVPGASQGVQLDWPSVTSVSTSSTSLSCAFPPCRSVDVTGQAGQFWVYIHRGIPSLLSPVSTSLYNPNAIDDNTFYTIGPISQGLLVFSDPKLAGTYYIVVNAHSQSQTSGSFPAWSSFDRVCAWDDRVFQPPAGTPEGSTCTNASPSAPFTIISIGGPTPTTVPTLPQGVTPTITPTPTSIPIIPPSVTPTGMPTPTLPPGVTPTRTPTPTPIPIGRATSVPTGVAGLGPNATGLFVSLNLEGFPGTYVPIRRTEPITVNLRSQTASISAGSTIAYSDVSRRFDGLVDLGDNVADGEYNLFVKATSYLRRDFGTVSIRARTINFVSFSPGPLLSCDLNNDNIVNVLDFGQVYTDIRRTGVKDSLADIGRDGRVDVLDHNFCVQNFLKEGARL